MAGKSLHRAAKLLGKRGGESKSTEKRIAARKNGRMAKGRHKGTRSIA